MISASTTAIVLQAYTHNRALNACVQTRKCDKKVAEFGKANANHGPIFVGPGYLGLVFIPFHAIFLSLLLLPRGRELSLRLSHTT